jgi:ribose transport system substrate-binding protein
MLRRREILALPLGFAACNRGSGKPVVGVVPKGTNHIFWQTIHAGALKAASEYDFEALWNAPQLEIDASRQITIVENLITRQVAGIVLAPVDEEALVAVVERAADLGIPVSIFDSGIKTDKILTYVATDNYEAGRMAGRRMGEILGGSGKVGVIGFMPGSASTMQREQGFVDVIAEEFPGIENLGVRFNMADRAKAMEEAENLMTAHPDLAGLFADNESSTDGTVRAVKQRGAAGKVKIVGFDASEELIAEMRAGATDSIVVQDPFKMGYEATRAMGEHLAGREPVREMDSGAYLITPENVDTPEMQAVLFPPIEQWLQGVDAGH